MTVDPTAADAVLAGRDEAPVRRLTVDPTAAADADPSSGRQEPTGHLTIDPTAADTDPIIACALDLAFDLAVLGPAYGPNPRVGCVIVNDSGVVVGQGFHRGAGTVHAEVAALEDARASGGTVEGATAVVTLEPCHHQGRTGPCSRALAQARIGSVVYAATDPNPIAGGGADWLRGQGIAVVGPLAQARGRELNRAWTLAVTTGRPLVTLKLGCTLDGRIAAADGTSQWITSPEARTHVHALRERVDAIVIGTGTMLADDPALTARGTDGGLAEHQPLRVVAGRRAIPAGARLNGPGGELIRFPDHDPAGLLDLLAAREVRHVLLEGGAGLASAFLRADLVDQIALYLAPRLLGSGTNAIGDFGVTTLVQAPTWRIEQSYLVGPDVYVEARRAWQED